MSLASTTDDAFEDDVLNAGKPVLVDYWAEWCPPCKAMLPALEEINREFDGKLTVIKLNIDEHPVTGTKYGVRGIPTMMLFKDGQVAATMIGARPKGKVVAWINAALNLVS